MPSVKWICLTFEFLNPYFETLPLELPWCFPFYRLIVNFPLPAAPGGRLFGAMLSCLRVLNCLAVSDALGVVTIVSKGQAIELGKNKPKEIHMIIWFWQLRMLSKFVNFTWVVQAKAQTMTSQTHVLNGILIFHVFHQQHVTHQQCCITWKAYPLTTDSPVTMHHVLAQRCIQIIGSWCKHWESEHPAIVLLVNHRWPCSQNHRIWTHSPGSAQNLPPQRLA